MRQIAVILSYIVFLARISVQNRIEVKQKVLTHAQIVHKEMLSKMTSKQLDELNQNVIKAIHQP